MVLPGAWCSLSGFEYQVTLPMPNVPPETLFPRPNSSCLYRFPEPTLNTFTAIRQVARTHAGIGPATISRSGEARAVLMVWTANVPAGLGYFGQINTPWRCRNLARLGIVALESRFTHDSEPA